MPKNLKIALICDHFLPQIGGIEIHVHDLAQQLLKQGHLVHVLTSMPGESQFGSLRVHRIQASLLPGSNIIWRKKALKEMTSYLLREKYDILHCHNSIVSPLAYGSLWLAKKLNIPTLLTTHSLFNHGSISFFRSIQKLKSLKHWPIRFSAVSQEAASRVQRAFPQHSVFTLENGIDLDQWKTQKIKHSRPQITMVLRLHKKKRPQDFIQVLPWINSQVSEDLKPQVHIIGEGPLRPQLEKMVLQQGLSEQVKLLGKLTRPEIKDFLSQSDLFILPSPWESLPITALEACASSVPVIGRASSGVRDIIRHNYNGMLANSIEELGTHTLALLQNPEQLSKLTKNARPSVKKFGWNEVIAKHSAIYYETIENCQKNKRNAA